MDYDIDKIAYILQPSKLIAIVGLSPKPERPSHQVAKYLMEHNYTIVPVNPGHQEILGQKCYSSWFEIPFSIVLARQSRNLLKWIFKICRF